jgi:signal transduction histidine kinase
MLLERLNQVVTELTALQGDAEKADRGNKAAARRVRVALQDAKKALQEVRQASFGVDSGEGVAETAEG